MSTQALASLSLHGSGLRAELSADRDGDCWLEITLAESTPGNWRLEVVWQPVDDRGLARGFGCQLFQAPLEFAATFDDQPRAYVLLPSNISFDLARKCYYRIERRGAPGLSPA
ncbi:MAG: hypothetical protein U1A77_24785 [Pirellulales bacterium]